MIKTQRVHILRSLKHVSFLKRVDVWIAWIFRLSLHSCLLGYDVNLSITFLNYNLQSTRIKIQGAFQEEHIANIKMLVSKITPYSFSGSICLLNSKKEQYF